MALATRNAILEEDGPTSLDFNSPSVGILAQRFPGPGKCQVLDLGAPAESNVGFFAGGACTLYVEDLHRFLIAPEEKRKGDADEDPARTITDALSYGPAARFDLVLGWDLFSYMKPSVVKLLMAHIGRSCRPGTLLFITTSTGAMIPGAPARMTMTRLGRLHYQSDPRGPHISNPRLSPTALENMMPGFRLLHSFLLGDKMQEFLFSYT
jgi:hypothetical protein